MVLGYFMHYYHYNNTNFFVRSRIIHGNVMNISQQFSTVYDLTLISDAYDKIREG